MNELAKMIYEKWAEDHAESALYFDTGAELVKRIEGTLSFDLADEFYTLFCDSCKEVESNAFREGFEYACKCLSNGKIEFSK